MLKYLKYNTACDIAFGVFMVAWFALRHVAYLAICYSVFVDIPRHTPFGCYWGSNGDIKGPVDVPAGYGYLIEPFRNPTGLICQTTGVNLTFLSMLLLLQIILLIWFWMIINVAWKVVTGRGAEDSRSDDEGEEEEDEKEEQVMHGGWEESANLEPLEEEVGVEDLSLNGKRNNATRVFKMGSSASSGVSLSHDRKELLGRIGCDKQP